MQIREIRADDGERLRASHARLSAESRYRRFLGAKPTRTEAARYLVQIDGREHYALVATASIGGRHGEIIAVARAPTACGRWPDMIAAWLGSSPSARAHACRRAPTRIWPPR